MDVFQAVADPVRRRLVELLSGGERTAGELAAAVHAEFGLGQPATSKHLRELRYCSIVSSRVDGPRRVYRLHPDGLDELAGWARRQTRFWTAKLDALVDELDADDLDTKDSP